MGGFFTLMAIGLSSRLPQALAHGLTAAGVSPAAAAGASHVSPVGTLFAAFLGDNPVKELVPNPGPGVDTSTIYGRSFFPNLISGPFMHGLLIAFGASILMLLIAAGVSLMRGERYIHDDADGSPHRDTVVEAMAREGGALTVPSLLDEDDTYDDAATSRGTRLRD
jgi:hypothetical protein